MIDPSDCFVDFNFSLEADLVDSVHVFSSIIRSQGCKTMCGDNLASTPPEYQTIAQPDSALHFLMHISEERLMMLLWIICAINIARKVEFICEEPGGRHLSLLVEGADLDLQC